MNRRGEKNRKGISNPRAQKTRTNEGEEGESGKATRLPWSDLLSGSGFDAGSVGREIPSVEAGSQGERVIGGGRSEGWVRSFF